MSKLIELDKLDRVIKDSKIRLGSIKTNVELLDKEINALEPRRFELERSIGFLKQQETIPLAHEYRKIKSELTKTVARLKIITVDRNKAHQAALDVEKIIEKFQRDYQKLAISGENNILKPNFGGNNGKK
jgi:chromosome segregation ATPase